MLTRFVVKSSNIKMLAFVTATLCIASSSYAGGPAVPLKSIQNPTPLIADPSFSAVNENQTVFESATSLAVTQPNAHAIANLQAIGRMNLQIHSILAREFPAKEPDSRLPIAQLGKKLEYFSILGVGFLSGLMTMPESITRWNKQSIMNGDFAEKWARNVNAGPTWDHDDWEINLIGHPVAGASYYMLARTSGFDPLEAFGFSALMSTLFWEYGLEAFAEIPSEQDLVLTPVVGSLLGEALFFAHTTIHRNHRELLGSRLLGETSLFLLDPAGSIVDLMMPSEASNSNRFRVKSSYFAESRAFQASQSTDPLVLPYVGLKLEASW